MWVDSITQLWGQLSLDYSSHTAVAVALLGAICASSRRLGFLAAALIGLYVPLMIYQGYHSLADIASTALAVGVPVWALAYVGSSRDTRQTANNSFKPKPLRGSA